MQNINLGDFCYTFFDNFNFKQYIFLKLLMLPKRCSMQFLSSEEYWLHYENLLSNSVDLMKILSAALSAKNGHLALLEDIRHGWLALSRGSSNHHLHATTPMSSLANGFTSRLSNVSLLKMMKTLLSAMHRGRKKYTCTLFQHPLFV